MIVRPAALLQRRRTKIVATVGPASRDPSTMAALIQAGAGVIRLNLAHGAHAEHAAAAAVVRAAAAAAGEPVALLADLCGPKIRVGRFTHGAVTLATGAPVTVTTRPVQGGGALIPSAYASLVEDVQPGHRVLLDDGRVELRVDTLAGPDVHCTVVHGGVVTDRKGINLPDSQVSAPVLTPQDERDVAFAVELGVEYLALSFVRSVADVHALRQLLPPGAPTRIVAKIERPEALDAADEILAASDGVMIARGDLGVELPPEVVPVAQRWLVARARAAGKPCIVATQMLESMVTDARPTRAEVSDVSTAVFSGADAVMLSAETAVGAHPVAAVTMMDRIARRIEAQQWSEGTFQVDEPPLGDAADESAPATTPRPAVAAGDGGTDDTAFALYAAVARSTAQLSRDLRVRAIVVPSTTGASAAAVAAARPAAPVLAVSVDPFRCRQMNLLWGVVPVPVDGPDLPEPRSAAREVPTALGLAGPGEHVLAVSGFSAEPALRAPTVTVLRL